MSMLFYLVFFIHLFSIALDQLLFGKRAGLKFVLRILSKHARLLGTSEYKHTVDGSSRPMKIHYGYIQSSNTLLGCAKRKTT